VCVDDRAEGICGECLQRLRYTLKTHTNVKGMVEHVKALTNQLELEAKLQHIIANAKSPYRHTTAEVPTDPVCLCVDSSTLVRPAGALNHGVAVSVYQVRRALNQSMGIAHEVLLSRVEMVLMGADFEDELLAAANLKVSRKDASQTPHVEPSVQVSLRSGVFLPNDKYSHLPLPTRTR
jgi:hypothetical protein